MQTKMEQQQFKIDQLKRHWKKCAKKHWKNMYTCLILLRMTPKNDKHFNTQTKFEQVNGKKEVARCK